MEEFEIEISNCHQPKENWGSELKLNMNLQMEKND